MAQTVPLVDEATYVLAVVGVTDPDPTDDGWFLADFALLNRLLQYQGHEQHWFGSIDLESATQQYGPVLWGLERHNDRKIVLDVHEGLSEYHQHPIDQLKHAFLEELRRICNIVTQDARILILLVGNGEDPPNYGLWIGDQDEPLTPHAPTPTYIFKHEVDGILANLHSSVNVCLLLSSCFSGGWVCSNNSRSVMAAASGYQTSTSFPTSVSHSNRGSYFIHAIVEAMQSSQIEESDSTYRQFTDRTRNSLYNGFSLAHEHQMPVFTAQDDQWEVPMSRITVLSLQHLYQQRFQALASYPSAHATTLTTTHAPGSRRSSRRLEASITHYLNLRPGLDNASNNIAIHNLIYRFRTGIPRPMDLNECKWLSTAVRFRCLLASWVETAVQMLWLSPFPSFSSWDDSEWRKARFQYSQYQEHAARAYEVLGRFPILFPKGPRLKNFKRLQSFAKVKQYLIAAVIARGIDQLEFHRRLVNFLLFYDPAATVPSDVY